MSAAPVVQKNELLLFYTLLELAVIVLAGRVGNSLARRCGQSGAVGEIIIGLLLGPSLFGWLAPQTFDRVFRTAPPEPLQILSSLGLVLLMFQIGLEFDFDHLLTRHNRSAVLGVALACLAAPFGFGLVFGHFAAAALSPAANPLHSALFIATAFSITALPILGRILIEFDLTRTSLGVIAISAAAINDVVGWLMLALITALTTDNFHGRGFGMRIALLLGYALLCLLLVRPLVKRVVQRSLMRSARLSPNLIGSLLALVFVSAICTYQLGIFAIFGGFVMGVILYDELEFVRAWRERVGEFVNVFFLPIFFTYTGLRTSIGSLATASAWGWCAATVAVATCGKLGAGYLAARLLGRSHAESATLGYLMNTRALMELVVINVGFDLGVISQPMFTMLVIMAVLSTMITSPALRHYLPRLGYPVPARAARAV